MNKVILFLFSFLMLTSCFAQKITYTSKSKRAIAHFETALRAYEYGRNSEAFEEVNKAIKEDDKFIEAHQLLGQMYLDFQKSEDAIIALKKVIELDPKFSNNTFYMLAKAEMSIGKYSDAEPHLQAFLSGKMNPALKADAEKLLERSRFCDKMIKSPVPFNPINLGSKVNSTEEDYHPTITTDESMIIFTRKDPTGIKNNGDTSYAEDFYYAVKQNNEWQAAVNFGRPINTETNEGAQSISPDGQWLFFTACHRQDGKGSCDLYSAHKKGNHWDVPVNLGAPINSAKWESQPSLSSDGRTLYFSSSRGGGKGGTDIWKSVQKDDGTWSAPVNMEKLNTPEDEMSPFIHPDDKTIYFASKGHIGMGGFDLFMSKLDEYGQFTSPMNLGYPINTHADEHGLIVGASGEYAYFSSGREKGVGKLDLYSFELYEAARPSRVTYSKGKVYNAENKNPLAAHFELIDLATKQVVVSSNSNDQNGEFLVCLPVNKDYALNVSKEGFLFYSENFSLTEKGNSSSPYQLDVPLQPIKEGGVVILKNIFFETAKFDLKPQSMVELEKLKRFMDVNSTIKIEIGGHTDNVGSKESNKVLSENRAKAVFDYLVSNGISTGRMSFKGYGDTTPLSSNDSEPGRAQNRRTEFRIIQK